jgi:ketosteroid isomerase-like protein
MTAEQDTARQISELEARRYQAMTEADTATLGELLASDLVYTHSDTRTDSGPSFLDKLVSGALDYGPIEHPEHAIVVHGDCALVFGDMRGEVYVDGQLRVLNSRALAVWVRENGRWVLLAFQPTRYPA